MGLHRQLLSGALVVVLLSSCGVFEAGGEEGPILPVAEARRQAQQARLAFNQASRQSDAAIAHLERLIPHGPSAAYDQADIQSEAAMDQMMGALEQILDTEHELWRALQHQLGKDTEAFWLAWDEWERWKTAHTEPSHN